MPWEDIGSVDTGSVPGDAAWIKWCQRFAKSYILMVCGDPPPGCDLDITECDYELGSYPTLGVWYDWWEPSDYIHRCEAALSTFNRAIEWGELRGYLDEALAFDEDDGGAYEDDENDGEEVD